MGDGGVVNSAVRPGSSFLTIRVRLLRRLEKNHDGSRSAATRQHYIQIYQAMKYLSLDVADFIEKGPQLAELPDV